MRKRRFVKARVGRYSLALCAVLVVAGLGVSRAWDEQPSSKTTTAHSAAQPAPPSSTPAVPPCEQILEQRAIVPGIDTNQDDVDNRVSQGGHIVFQPSHLPFKNLLERGRHLFTTPFTEADGAGEGMRDANGNGALGPREMAFKSNLKLVQGTLGLPNSDFGKLLDLLQPPYAKVNANGDIRFSILRLNGLDSQSCFECHNSIGSAHPGGDGVAAAFDRKPGTTGGPAGQASNAFINDTLPNPVFKFVRNPPHVFGTGYVQKLGETMTLQFLTQKVTAYATALQFPGQEITQEISFKDPKGRVLTDFGNIKVTFIGDVSHPPDLSHLKEELVGNAELDLTQNFREDDSALEGVSSDLVVRPLQWKGIASNERNFVRSALAFHFGMAPKELNPDYGTLQENRDPDNDGVLDDATEGNVSTLSIFTMSIRVPVQIIPPGKEALVERGTQLFSGETVSPPSNVVIGLANSCAKCHKSNLPLYSTQVCVRDPRDDGKYGAPKFSHTTSLVARQVSSRRLPIYQSFREHLTRALQANPARFNFLAPSTKSKGLTPSATSTQVFAELQSALAAEPSGCPARGYEFDLTMKPGSPYEGLSFCYPRLKWSKDQDGKDVVQVPILSDLKRHDMGEGLTDQFDQGTDVASINVPRRLYLTRPLWGVADSGPWLHDGRARTLREAILMHESLGSEANQAIEDFKKLSCDDQSAIVEFLLSLHLDIDCRYKPCFEHPADCKPEPVDGRVGGTKAPAGK